MRTNLSLISNTIFSSGGKLLSSLGLAGASLGRLNLHSPSWDLFVLLIFGIAVFLYAFTLGKGRIVVFLCSVYMAFVITETFPWSIKANLIGKIPNKLIIFAVAVVLIFLMLVRSGLASIFRATAEGSWIETFIFSVLQIGLLTSILISYFSQLDAQALMPLSSQIFASQMARFIWAALPLIALTFIKKHRSYSRAEY